MQGFKYFKREDIERYADESENGLFWFSTILNNEPHICIVTPVNRITVLWDMFYGYKK
ncbi:hypothetical protein [Clostridium perfringens]|uniref:hypothetical protein n=1 Tax=Clostridium perfringens TaxID=1502 RepID=UPI001F2B645A|nr:hypothetical protein [Clostridium perfringens]